MDDSVDLTVSEDLTVSDSYDVLDSMTLFDTDGDDVVDIPETSVRKVPEARTRRELERLMEERALEKELNDWWQ